MTAGSSFSGATTMFVSLAICAIISYGVFYYFKQRLAIIEQSQMEQARILQAIISRGLAQHAQAQQTQQAPEVQPAQSVQAVAFPTKEITITQNGLIEVSSDETDTETDTDSDSDESHSSHESQSSDKWSIGDEIHQPDGYHEEFTEKFKKNILLDAICIDGSYVIDNITISVENVDATETQQKKIISLNNDGLIHNEHASDNDNDDNDDDDDDSSSSEDHPSQSQENDKENTADFELKIGYKPASSTKGMHLNYGNMSVSALRQLAKERKLGGEDGDLQKLKKKDLVQLLQ